MLPTVGSWTGRSTWQWMRWFCRPTTRDAGTLSGGEARRVALCRLLLQKPDILLLDEPTNHLDAETVQWLEDTLSDYAGNVIVSTHDRYFLDNITKWILELTGGKGIPFEGNYSSWLEQKSTQLAQREKSESSLQKRLDKRIGMVEGHAQRAPVQKQGTHQRLRKTRRAENEGGGKLA